MSEKICEITSSGKAAVISFMATSICSSEGISQASDQINSYIDESHPGNIIIDFEQVKFFSSQVLGVLLNIRNKLKNYGGEVAISSINPQLYRVFRITNLEKIFRFFPDKESALKAVNSQ
jgi:anti-sigma B factor antagonist